MSGSFSRRTLLRGLGAGGALLSPLARRLTAEAQGAVTPNLIVFYTPNGFYRSAFGADGTASNFTLRSSTASLEPHKQDLLVLEGLNNFAYPTGENSHGNVYRILSCRPGPKVGVGDGPSFDHAVATHYGTTPLVLGVYPQRSDFTWHRQLSWAATGSAVRPQLDTPALFSQLFPDQPAPGGTNDGAAARNRRNKSVLDALRSDIGSLQGKLDAAGKEKLDLHLTGLRELEQSITESEVPQLLCDSAALETKAGAALPWPSSGTPRTSKAFTPLLKAHGELQCDLAATAIACGRKRVATIIWQECSWEGVNVDGVNANESHHKVSHYASDPITGDGPTQLKACDSFYAARFGYLINRLKTLGILDNTIVLWLTEIAEGHVQVKFTWMAAGGKALGIKTGQYLKYPYSGPGNHPHTATVKTSTSDLFVSLQRALGIDKGTFGDPQWCFRNGLSEVYAG